MVVATLQGERQRAFRDLSGAMAAFNGDMISAFNIFTNRSDSVANESLMNMLKQTLNTSVDDINDLMNMFASARGVYNWNSLGYDDIINLAINQDMWIAASDTDSITESGGVISYINDKGLDNNDIDIGTAAWRPSLTTDGGYDAILMDGADDRLPLNSCQKAQKLMILHTV